MTPAIPSGFKVRLVTTIPAIPRMFKVRGPATLSIPRGFKVRRR